VRAGRAARRAALRRRARAGQPPLRRTWTTEYYGLAIAALRRAGRHIDDEVLAHIWPTHHENVNFYGSHAIDLAGELAKLDADGYRPLRSPTPASAPAI